MRQRAAIRSVWELRRTVGRAGVVESRVRVPVVSSDLVPIPPKRKLTKLTPFRFCPMLIDSSPAPYSVPRSVPSSDTRGIVDSRSWAISRFTLFCALWCTVWVDHRKSDGAVAQIEVIRITKSNEIEDGQNAPAADVVA